MVTSIQSLLQPVPSREALGRQTRTLRVGETVAVEELARWLVESGFLNTPAVELPGEFSSAAASSTSSRPTGTTRSASSSSATRSSRSAGSRSPASGAWNRWTRST